ncbi:MAG: hypothetical protein WDZ83_06335 [Rhizobiaceae bacterium]
MARVRSPAYPALSLPAAVDAIRKVHGIQQRTPEPRDVVLKHMGYSGESGRALKAISALIKYGFLEKSGEGLRVSNRAVTILYPENEEDRIEALHEAANEPSLFVEIFRRWEGRPSEESLKAFLIREGFNVNSVESVARAFYDTFDLVSGTGGSYDSGGSDEPNAEPEDTTVPEPQQPKKGGLNFVRHAREAAASASRNVTKPVFDFDTVQVNTVIDNRDDLAELISRLEQLKSMLPEKVQH